MDALTLLDADLVLLRDIAAVAIGAALGLPLGIAWYQRERRIGRMTLAELRARRRRFLAIILSRPE